MTRIDPENSRPPLAEPDQAAVDLLIEHGFDLESAQRANPSLSDRLAAAHAFFARLDRYPVESPDPALVDATLARIDRFEDERDSRMAVGNAIGSATGPRVGRGRWTDFIAVACAAVLALSIGLPLLHQFRMRSQTAACSANLSQLHAALDAYYGDFAARPFAAGLGPDLSGLASWNTYDNSRHLDVLHQANYCGAHCVCCGNDADRAGYASQVPSRHLDPMWAAHANMPLIADRNPLVFQTAFGGRARIAIVENSPDHGGDGQNVLYGDGSVRFATTPILTIQRPGPGGLIVENIWIPADRQGDERELHAPRSWGAEDVFLLQ